MMLLALVGIVFNGAAVLKVRCGTSLTGKVVSWHLLEDVLGWVAVLIGAAVMSVADVPQVDPLLSIGISLFVLWNVLRNLRGFFEVFIQRSPRSLDVERFERQMLSIPKVISLHHTHSWSIDGEKHVLTTHLVMQADTTRQDILNAKQRIRNALDEEAFEHVTVEVEKASLTSPMPRHD